MNLGVDPQAEHAAAQKALADALREHRKHPRSALAKLRYTAAKEEMVRVRQFWRGVDVTVEAGSPGYGTPQGRGRRGGEPVYVENPEG